MAIRRIIPDLNWLPIKDGDPRAFALYRRHYSYKPYKDGRRQNTAYRNRHLICGPGEKMLLLSPGCDALFIWRKFIDKSASKGLIVLAFEMRVMYSVAN